LRAEERYELQRFHPATVEYVKEDSVMSRNRDELDSLLRQSFTEGVRWPIDRASLRALLRMGLTVTQIAGYFSIDLAEVQELLNRH
jgi:hypothetical protein